MGLEDDDATASLEAAALKAKAHAPGPARPPARAPAPEPDEERTTAFSIADLPPEDDVRPTPSTLVSSKPGAAVRGGAAPIKRNETLALAPSAARAAVQQAQRAPEPEFEDEKTAALSVDDIGKIEAMKAARIAAKAAAAAAAQAPAPKPAAAPKAPAHIEENERTMAVSLDDAIAAVDSAPPKKPSVVKSSQAAHAPAAKGARPAPAAFEDEKTSALSVDDIDKIEAMKAARIASKAAATADAASRGAPVPAKAAAVKASGARSLAKVDLAASEGFIGAIGYAFKHDALETQIEAGKIGRVELDPARKTAGMRNLIIVGGAVGALMLLFGIIF